MHFAGSNLIKVWSMEILLSKSYCSAKMYRGPTTLIVYHMTFWLVTCNCKNIPWWTWRAYQPYKIGLFFCYSFFNLILHSFPSFFMSPFLWFLSGTHVYFVSSCIPFSLTGILLHFLFVYNSLCSGWQIIGVFCKAFRKSWFVFACLDF